MEIHGTTKRKPYEVFKTEEVLMLKCLPVERFDIPLWKEVSQLVGKLLEERAYRNLRKVQGIFRLGDKYGKEELNLTCKRCLHYEDYQMSTIKKVLEEKLYQLPLGDEDDKGNNHAQEGLSFIRPFFY